MTKNTRSLIPHGLIYIADNIHTKDNMLGLRREAKTKWAAGMEFPRDKSTIFFAGCGYQYSSMLEPLVALVRTADKVVLNPDLPVALAGIPRKLGIDVAGLYARVVSREDSSDAPVLRDAIKVLKTLGINAGYLGEDEPCCGAPLYHMGLRKEFASNAGRAYLKLQSSGVRKVIGIVPSCTYALKSLFPKVVTGFDIEVSHFIEVVAEKIAEVNFKYPLRVKVAYHDPCQLGRYMGLIEQPRQVLKAIGNVELVEPEWTSGEWSTCCGGGGGFEVVFPDLSHSLASNRAAELADTGADIIVTQCPGCLMQLRDGLKQLKKKIEVMDIATLLARSLP